MADLDDIQRTLLEIRDLMKQEMDATAKHAEESRRSAELALARQATAMRAQRIGGLVLVLLFVVLYWYLSTQIEF